MATSKLRSRQVLALIQHLECSDPAQPESGRIIERDVAWKSYQKVRIGDNIVGEASAVVRRCFSASVAG